MTDSRLLFLDPDAKPAQTVDRQRVINAIREYDSGIAMRRTDDTLRRVARHRSEARYLPVIAGQLWFPGWSSSAGNVTDYVSATAEFTRLRRERDWLRTMAARTEAKAA